MNKFKFEPPQEHRRSLQQPKNEHLNLIAALDKCTQILRQDRLFLRNQIKNSNPEVLELFKQFPRASQLQNLQIKLRKYVQNVKGRIKAEQLNKFKQTLCSTAVGPEPKRQNTQMMPSQSTLKQAFKPSQSTELNRTTNLRNHKSQDHSSPNPNPQSYPNHLNMNSSLRHFQEIIKHKFATDVIEQRDSENVTSARQARQQQNEQNKAKPLQEQFYDSIQNKMAGRVSPSFNNFVPSKDIEESLHFLNDFKRDKSKFYQQQESAKLPPWDIEKKAKKVLYQFRNQNENQPEININFCEKSRHKESVTYEQKQDSIFDKNFYEAERENYQMGENDYFSHSSIANDIKRPITFSIKDTPANHLASSNLSNLFDPVQSHKRNDPTQFKLKESDFLPVQAEVQGKITSYFESSRKSEQNLFTPLQLLNQCRNFLKQRENSSQKSNVTMNLPQPDLCQLSSSLLPSASEVKPPKRQEKEVKQQESGYVFPEIKESSKKQEKDSSDKKMEVNQFTHFQTFANYDQKTFAFPPALSTGLVKHTFKGLAEQKMPRNFSIEDFLESCMEATDMNPFITVKALDTLLNSHPNKEVLRLSLRKCLELGPSEEVCLTDLSFQLNEKYNEEYKEGYPHHDKVINSVYDLLDIDQKGFINEQDLKIFLTQIEEAEVENFEEVEEGLWRLFEGADFNNKHRLTYWHFYLVKSSEEFETISHLLEEFEFEIERTE